MNKLLSILSVFCLTGCTIYKVEPKSDLTNSIDKSEEIFVTSVGQYSKSNMCPDSREYNISLGLIPSQCIYRFEVSTSSKNLGTVQVTTMKGWLPLFMAPLPSWHVGYGERAEPVIRELVHKQ